jgi:holo-[acyl-carrier protein] synthase
MDAGTKLRKTVAEFFDVDERQVEPSFSLLSCQGSIARAAFDAAIRRGVGLKSRAVYSARTFGELAADLGIGHDGASASPGPASTLPSLPPQGGREPESSPSSNGHAGASCGVDIELVEHLPVVVDPWEDPFYRSHFSSSEIAYCVRQPEPLLHFAARWCAKEALKKCDRAFLAIEGKDVEVVNDEAGAPHLVHLTEGSSRRLPHAVSLSHTTHAAVAMVVRIDAIQPAPVEPVVATVPAPIEVAPPAPSPKRSRLVPATLVLLNLITLGLAAVALYRTFPGLYWPWH